MSDSNVQYLATQISNLVNAVNAMNSKLDVITRILEDLRRCTNPSSGFVYVAKSCHSSNFT